MIVYDMAVKLLFDQTG